MKTRKLVLPLLVGVLAVLAMAVALSQNRAAADVHREWDNNWYWKDGGWTDYAPNGVPDFDQKQDAWQDALLNWSFCGPVAAANSLWWFDSKFEPYPVGPPGGPPSTIPYNDYYHLVTSYGGWPPAWDDHDPQNVAPLVSDLAWYFDTDGQRSGDPTVMGTEVHTMAYGLQRYLYDRYYYDDYHVQLVKMPTFEWVEEVVERSEDVILLLGFWQDQAGGWKRIGGHYVTVVGINSTDLQIAFSDPFLDNAETGSAGRVLSGTLITHNPPHPGLANIHNDAGNISHDIYTVTLAAASPGGLWEIEDYKFDLNFEVQNCPQEFIGDQYTYEGGTDVFVEVEYAIAMSPFTWKPGGEWVDTWWNEQWITEWWWYEDDGDSCLPDFSWEITETWEAYDGPVAVGNSLWWFDSKAETLVTGGWPTEPPTVTDHYSLVVPHGDWDDHAITNTSHFVEDLAKQYLHTGISGTTSVSMANGIAVYLAASGVADDFYTKTQDSPTWEWIADEVETCDDLILLLGFYEYRGGVTWERKGGHWVNAAGVNRDGYLVGLSDPAINNAISPTLGLGRVFPPEHLMTPFMGADQSNPQAISHDVYRAVTSTTVGGQLALVSYPFTSTSVLTSLIGMNGGGDPIVSWADPFTTVVEWAIGVSPYSDLVLTKTAVVTEVVPGDRVTYTLEYANRGLAAVENVTITDILPLNYLTDISHTSSPPIYATQDATCVWTINRLSYGQGGMITITAESLVTATLYNTAYITGLNSIGDPTPDRDPNDNTSTICTPISLVMGYAPFNPQTGQTVYFTATAIGSSPIAYAWAADDGWTDSGFTANHAFTTGGNHTVWLTATNACGQGTDSAVIFVREYGVDLQPSSASQTEEPGEIATYTLTLNNTGNVADTYDIAGTVSGESWTTNWPATIGPVAAGGSAQFNVTVQIPSIGTNHGDWSQVTVTTTSEADPSKSDVSVLTTYVTWRLIYLPLVMRNHQ